MRAQILLRKVHYWGSLAIAIPLIIMIGAGVMLMVKKEFDWIQPPSQEGVERNLMPMVSMQELFDAASEIEKAGFTNLQENMEHDEQKDLSEAMANIMDSHDAMSKNMVGLAPMMKQAQELTEKLTKGGMGKLLAKASSYADKLGK